MGKIKEPNTAQLRAVYKAAAWYKTEDADANIRSMYGRIQVHINDIIGDAARDELRAIDQLETE